MFGQQTEQITWKLRDDARLDRSRWLWPLDRFDARDPLVTRSLDNGVIELGYDPRGYDSKLFIPVYAPNVGDVAFALSTPEGYVVAIDHGDTVTRLEHLSKIFVTECVPRNPSRRQLVIAGQVIGYAAKAPVHVRLSVAKWDGRTYGNVDAEKLLRSWVLPRTIDELRSPEAA
ncbi:MAG: M23 family metallopeptidase [Kofleriaceae bacterium]